MNLKLGDDYEEVGSVHQELLEAGCSIDAAELAAHRFGPTTELAVKAFQAAHVDLQGHRLDQDGVVGPMTLWALQHPAASAAPSFTAPGWRSDIDQEPFEVRQILAAAVGEIGTREEPDGSNRGPRVDQYTGPEGLGQPWCAYFVSWCWSRREEGSPFGKLGSVLKLKSWGDEHGRIVATPQPGDLFLIMRDHFHGHCGLVALVNPNGTICTVEGNCSNAVRGLIRDTGSITAFVRPLGG